VESASLLERTAHTIPPTAVCAARESIVEGLASGNAPLVCFNGVPAAGDMHITAELAGRFLENHCAFRAICLPENPPVLTAWSNDHSLGTVFARQVEAYGAVLLRLSTSTIALTGEIQQVHPCLYMERRLMAA
jgi:phosphoheptose isomerase